MRQYAISAFAQSVIRHGFRVGGNPASAAATGRIAFANRRSVHDGHETKLVIDGEGHTYRCLDIPAGGSRPVIRVQEGDELFFSLTNLETNGRPHSMDFHAGNHS